MRNRRLWSGPGAIGCKPASSSTRCCGIVFLNGDPMSNRPLISIVCRQVLSERVETMKVKDLGGLELVRSRDVTEVVYGKGCIVCVSTDGGCFEFVFYLGPTGIVLEDFDTFRISLLYINIHHPVFLDCRASLSCLMPLRCPASTCKATFSCLFFACVVKKLLRPRLHLCLESTLPLPRIHPEP